VRAGPYRHHRPRRCRRHAHAGGTFYYGTWKQIREAFPQADLVDATAILYEVRYVKSQEEINVLVQVDGDQPSWAMQAEVETAKAGVKDGKCGRRCITPMTRNAFRAAGSLLLDPGRNPKRTLTRPSMRLLETRRT